MSNIEIKNDSNYHHLVTQISDTFVGGQKKAVLAVNTHLVETYWKIGEYIVEYEQGGSGKAEYGKKLLERLSKDLTLLHGKGFSLSNMKRMRQFYLTFSIGAEFPHQFKQTDNEENRICTLPTHKLSWTHYVELLKIDDPLERSFYLQQSINESWSTTQLIRQKKASLYLRLAASKDKEGILKLAQKGQVIENPIDIIREPYILDFLQIPEAYAMNETEIEERIISQLQHFLLEMGKGFAFVGRQYRVMLGNRPHRIDLVFYHYILKCFVLIDLKREAAGYEDIGQMNMYLGYFEKEQNNPGDNPPIGIVLAREKDEYVIEYAMHNISSRLFISKYQLYLPTKEDLKRIVDSPNNRI
ncbi:MAG: PDDEXK nuclease domain-containing protein [Culturomica sp.]|jgi:predicted nuclease of restriction endonuclease-like (RecB) superfamily|nr:PDDEXK nuclease domain-containing protein [Culturomica sp.]